MIHTCTCGFRGKDHELVDDKCPRCGENLKQETPRTTRSRRRR